MSWIDCKKRLPKQLGFYWTRYAETELSNECECYSFFLGDAWEGQGLAPTHWYRIPKFNNRKKKTT